MNAASAIRITVSTVISLEPAGNSPQQYAAFIKAEIEKVAKIAKAIGLQPE